MKSIQTSQLGSSEVFRGLHKDLRHENSLLVKAYHVRKTVHLLLLGNVN